MLSFAPRQLHTGGLLVCIAALLIAFFFMEKYLALAPCPLCILDRIVIAAMAGVFLAAAVHNPTRLGQSIYAALNLAFGIVGSALTTRHIQLQNLPADELPDCAPDLGYMLETFPLAKTLSTVFNTSGECAEVAWTLLGLSIPQQTLLLFLALCVLCIVMLLHTRTARTH